MRDFVHLHVHDTYSLLDGICKTEALAARAKELGFHTLAQTNHGNVDGAVKFYKACKKQGIRPIVGSEIYVVDDEKNYKVKAEDGRRRYHLVILCKSFRGFQSLMRALTIANQKQFYYKPLISWKQVMEMEDVIVSSACTSGMLVHPQYQRLVQKFRARFKGDFYTETMPSNWTEQFKITNKAMDVWKKWKVPLLVTNDIHYLCAEDDKAHEVALAIGQRKRWSDADRWKFDVNGLYLKSGDEVRHSLLEVGISPRNADWMMDNACEAASKCEFKMENLAPDLPVPSRFKSKQGPERTLRDLARAGLIRLGKHKVKKYADRLEHELNEVISLGFPVYFLILADAIAWCRENGIMVGPGRGSSGGSLLALSIGITQVDPLAYDLSFERFISPGRIDLPDIDVDFQDDRRQEVIEYLRGEYGEESVLQVRTFGEMHGRQALRDVARVFNISNEEVGRASKAIIKRSGGDAREDFSIQDAFEIFEECKDFKRRHPEVVKVAMKLEGIVRQPGIHAAGVIITDGNLHDGKRCVVVNAKAGEKMVNWDRYDIDQFGLMKLDVLGLSTLTVLRRAKEAIKNNHGIDIEYEKIPLTDQKVLDAFSAGNTVGVFQFGTTGLSGYCKQMGIDSFERLVDVNALWRPGTLKSGMAQEYVEIKHGRKEVIPVSEFYDKITEHTYGIMLYQEQIMRVLYEGGGIGWRTVDTIRKAISKSEGQEKVASFKKEFTDGCARLKSMSEDEASAVFDKMVFFGSYGFNKSHAAAYTMIGYWTMYLKCYYPTEFYWALINFSSEAKRDLYVTDARRNGVKILLPDVNFSEAIWSIDSPGVLRAGLLSVTSVSDKSSAALLKARKDEPFGDLDNLVERVERRTVNKRVIQNLGKSGALRSIGVGALSCLDIDLVLKGEYQADEEENSDRVLSVIGEALDFPPSDDPAFRINNMVKLVKRRFTITPTKEILMGDESNYGKDHYLFGKIDKIKFTYRDFVQQQRDGQSTDFSGAYCDLHDDTGTVMITLGSNLMRSDDVDFKRRLESAEDVFALVRGFVRPNKANTKWVRFTTTGIVFLDDLVENVDLKLFPKMKLGGLRSVEFDRSLLDCTECNMRNGCRAPVMPSVGKYAAMVVAEAPGEREDEEGEGLVGKSGRVCWDHLLQFGIRREQVYVNNVLKCRPPNNKIPNVNYPKKCGKLWLEEEIKLVRPIVILAMGGTAANFFIPDSRITELSGQIHWINKFGAWVVFSLHPASLLYDAGNVKQFDEALAKFSGLIRKLF